MMDLLLLCAIVAVSVAAIFLVWNTLMNKKPDYDIVTTASPSKKRAKKKTTEPKKQETKWDKVDKQEVKARQEVDRMFDPVKEGEKVVKSAVQKEEKEQVEKLTQRQKNKLQSQGFVSVEEKKPRRSKSTEKAESKPDTDPAMEGMSPEMVERLRLLERITSGQRAFPAEDGRMGGGRGGGGDKPKLGEERRTDLKVVQERLDQERKAKRDEELKKTQVGKGRVVFQGKVAPKASTGPAWGGVRSPPPADAPAEDAGEEVAAEADE
eukprot:TRINITY_DN997_c0_g2_i1.p1 TRINITY_DN997_c0_g2~~TRINITY_DN997_c0_g2_i1.p1  ORF type:complete len:266 (+),score=130.20 TRINITY_DN997_c0_g2_i1:96-893(+)